MRGFTLIETIVYLALLSILLTSAIEALESVEESASSGNRAAITETEGLFVADKIDWVLAHESDAVIALDEAHHAIMLEEGSGEAVPLTSANVRAEALAFTPILDGGGAEAGIEASFTLDGVVFTTSSYYAP